jgi:hypothetical protein
MRVFSLFLIFLVLQFSVQGGEPPDSQGPATALQIRLVEGESTGVVSSPQAKGFTVEVTDAKGAAVAEVAVALRLPDSDATGVFADGTHAVVAYSDAQGRAHFPAVHWGAVAGSVSLRITASKGDLHAGLLIQATLSPKRAAAVAALPAKAQPVTPAPQTVTAAKSGAAPPPAIVPVAAAVAAKEPSVTITNSPDSHSHFNKKWLIAGVIAAAAVMGGALALKGKRTTPATDTTPGLSIGTPVVSVGSGH